MAELLTTLGLMIIGAAVFGLFAKHLKQPIIIGYVVVGILLGPSLLDFVPESEPVVLLSELGLIFLLFIIGLELDFSRIREIGKTSVLIGVLHVVIMTTLGTGAAMLFGFNLVQGLYVGLLLAISSTIVVAKLMQDKNESSSLHGEITMGILIVEDILAVLGLALLGSLSSMDPIEQAVGIPTLKGIMESAGVFFPGGAWSLIPIAVQGILFACFSYLLLKFVVARMYKSALQYHELFFVLSIAVVFTISGLGAFFGFSFAIGAFVAGLSLSSAKYSHEIMARLQPLKDFFLILFFVGLGIEIVLIDFTQQYVLLALVFFGAVFVKPIELYVLTRTLGYNIRTSFLVAIHLAQASEFGIILVASGVIVGALPLTFLTGAVVATILTMVLSTYLIEYEQRIYDFCSPYLHKLTRDKNPDREEIQNVPKKYEPEIVFFGVTPMTSTLIENTKRNVLVVDYNPERIVAYEKKGIRAICSDAIDPELYAEINFTKVAVVVSVIHDEQTTFHGPSSNRFLIKKIREINRRAMIVVTAKDSVEADRFYSAGATVVLTPHTMGQNALQELLTVQNNKHLASLLAFYRHSHMHNGSYRAV
ncbi:MAG: cation:proton antiporter [Candidatus Woesearchaeota archaeon]|nr:cation:proton antiporter [Candidatus Woesearchaeota archaeon]